MMDIKTKNLPKLPIPPIFYSHIFEFMPVLCAGPKEVFTQQQYSEKVYDCLLRLSAWGFTPEKCCFDLFM